MNSKQKNSLYVQGTILAFAGLITKIIGFIYRIPMANYLGNQGNGIYSVAFSIYGIALTLSSYSLPLAVSKLVSARLVRKEYQTIRRIFLNALLFATVVGGTATLVLFFGADVLEMLYKTPGLSKPLRVLAPTVFIVSFLGVFRGFFQGHGTMVPTAISQIIEQIFNAIVSVVAAFAFTKLYAADSLVAAYGASGGTLGTLTGAFTGLIFLIFHYFKTRPEFMSCQKQQTTPVENNKVILHALVMTIIPVIISQTIYQIGYTLDALLFGQFQALKGIADSVTTSLQGVYSTQYNQLINLPVAIATAMASSTIPAIVRANASGNRQEVKQKTNGVIKFNMVIAFPCAVGLSVLARPIIHLLYESLVEYEDTSVNLLYFGTAAVIFYALSTITTALLQGNNYMKLPVIHSAVSLTIHLVLVAALLYFTDLGIYALLIGNVTFPFFVCVFNCRSLMRHLDFHMDYTGLFIKPLVASLFMGIVTWAAYDLSTRCMSLFLSNDKICMLTGLLIAMIFAVISYFSMIGILRCFTKEELLELPMGSKLVKLMYRK